MLLVGWAGSREDVQVVTQAAPGELWVTATVQVDLV
jgi:hypothetical protein